MALNLPVGFEFWSIYLRSILFRFLLDPAPPGVELARWEEPVPYEFMA